VKRPEINEYTTKYIMMQTKYSFVLMTVNEFETWLTNLLIARTIIYLQQHHTFSPNYSLFKGNNHFELQKGMKNHHVNHNGWSDIGQHFTIFPDGLIMTGRSLEKSPACIYGNNSGAVCIENLGNFDANGDTMSLEQKNAIVKATAIICGKFSIPVNSDKVVYHHWFRLDNGVRNNGAGGNKTCPGTNFFGGNKVSDCEANFLPLVANQIAGVSQPPAQDVLKYVCVTATRLNVRKLASGSSAKVADRDPAQFGAVLRVYKKKNNWLKISSSKQHWVYGRYTVDVKRAVVNGDTLNVRISPKFQSQKLGAVIKNQEVFITKEENGWSKISLEEKWVKSSFLTFD
jgi:hypothetical protein